MLSALIILGIEDIFTWINYSYEDLMSKVQSSNKQSHSICFPAQGKFRTFYNVLYTLYLYDSIKVFVFFPMLWFCRSAHSMSILLFSYGGFHNVDTRCLKHFLDVFALTAMDMN